jgi:phosphoserine phosphatase RsbU/P
MIDSVDSLPCGYISFEDDGTILSCNTAFASWVGYSKEYLKGKNIESVLSLATRIFYNTHFFPLVKLQDQVSEIFCPFEPLIIPTYLY